MSSTFTGVKMADTSKDGLLLCGGIRHVTAISYFTRGSKQVLLAYVTLFKHVYFRQYFACVCTSCTKEYLMLQRVTVKLKLKFAAVISKIIGRSGRHFYGDIGRIPLSVFRRLISYARVTR